MGLFNFLNKKNGNTVPDVTEKVFIEKAPGVNDKPEEISAPTGMENNIDLLSRFLDRNHEGKGYDDALINPDSVHLTENMRALKNELERTIRKVKTFYEDFIKEINYHIDSRSRRGMVDTVEELKMKKEISESHILKVLQIEADAKNNTGDSQGILISYERGFKNGLAAISHHAIMKMKF